MSKLTDLDSRAADWRAQLAEATGKWAFVLSLSKRMIFFLTIVRDEAYTWSRDEEISHYPGFSDHRNHFIGGISALRNRGLVEPVFEQYQHDGKTAVRTKTYRLTPAGEAVCKLCEYVGLMKEWKPPVVLPAARVVARKGRAA